jgi:hypothetical protein
MSFDQALHDELNRSCLDTQGQSVKVNGEDITAIFNDAFENIQLGIGVGSSKPTLDCMTVDIKGVSGGCSVVANGVAYVVSGPIQPDSTGWTTLELEEE